MRISVLGGGPAGLYFAILMKQTWPRLDITVHERNRPDDTFGFGVVFSDQTLETFERYDPESYRAITDAFAYWDDIEIRFQGTRAPHRRQRVLRLRAAHAAAAAARPLPRARRRSALRQRIHIARGHLPASDLIVVADGINSVDPRAAPRAFPAPASICGPTASPGWARRARSTPSPSRSAKPSTASSSRTPTSTSRAIRPGCWKPIRRPSPAPGSTRWTSSSRRASWSACSPRTSDGHRLLVNRSLWRRFPMIRNARWVMGNVVLLGDAKSTAHFSIGSGTKLAMEDAIALYESVPRPIRTSQAALARFRERDRRDEVERTQHAADVSLVWFEHVARFWHMDPTQFAFGLMTRSKSITYDNLRLRAPDFVAETDACSRDRCARAGSTRCRRRRRCSSPSRCASMVLANRVVVCPMCMYSASDGMPDDFHLVHYGSRAQGGAGLMFTEMTVHRRRRAHHAGLRRAVDRRSRKRRGGASSISCMRSGQTKFCLQLGHAGRKGRDQADVGGDRPPARSPAPGRSMAPSPLPYYPDSQVPREMTRADMDRVRDDFVAATRRGVARRLRHDRAALRARLSARELHLAADQPAHRRIWRQRWKTGCASRWRCSPRCATAWPNEKPMTCASRPPTGRRAASPARIRSRSRAPSPRRGCDLIDVSSGQTTPDAAPVYGRMFQTPFADADPQRGAAGDDVRRQHHHRPIR